MRLYVCLFTASLMATAAVAQTTPPRDGAVPAANAAPAMVRGRITDTHNGRPIPGAIVRMTLVSGSATPSGESAQAVASADGSYEIGGLVAGDYVVLAGPAEMSATHLHHAFGLEGAVEAGARASTSPGISLRSGEVRDNVDIRLTRALAIEGRVVNEYGEPLADVEVTVRALTRGVSVQTNDATSDDRGQFRIFGLAPGGYHVCAQPLEWTPFRASSGDALQARLMRTCHPSALVESDAEPVMLSAADVGGIVIQLQRSGTFTISGRVVDASGTPAIDAHVNLMRVTREGSSSGAATPEIASGTFVIRGVAPGDYLLLASAGHSREPYERDAPEIAYYPLRVEAGNVTGLLLTTSPGATILGRIVFDGDVRPAARLVVQTRRPLEPGFTSYGPPASARVREDLTFELTRLYGPMAVGVNGLPKGWVLKSVTYRGKEVTDVATEFSSVTEPDGFLIAVTNRAAKLIVRAVDDKGERAGDAQVIVLPANPQQWALGMIPGPGPMSPPNGALDSIRGGEYLIAAIPSGDVMLAWRDPAGMAASIAKIAQRISIDAGSERTIDVAVRPLPLPGR